jgi:hypothetical protein
MNSLSDALIREINEDVRRDRLTRLWKKYGSLLIGGIILLVLAVAGAEGWRSYQRSTHADASRRLAEAARLTATDPSAAAQAFTTLADEGPGDVAVLARLRAADALARAGDRAGALDAYQKLAASTSDPLYGSLGTLFRAMLVLVQPQANLAALESLSAELAPLTAADQPWRYTAQEILAAVALERGDRVQARELLDALRNDPLAPSEARSRAGQVLTQSGMEDR